MRKILAFLICALLLSSIICSNAVFAAEKNESENNDSFSNANPISVGDILNGAISAVSDTDIFKVQLTNSLNVNISLSNIPAGCDYDLFLYNSSGSQTDSSRYGSNSNESICKNLTEGTYYIKVISYSGSSVSCYKLSISAAGTNGSTPVPTSTPTPTPNTVTPTIPPYHGGDMYEFNDSLSLAKDLGDGNITISEANIHPLGDVDYFKFHVNNNISAYMTFTNPYIGLSYSFAIYNSSFSPIISGGGSGEYTVNLTPGTYYIKIYGIDSESVLYYRFRMTVTVLSPSPTVTPAPTAVPTAVPTASQNLHADRYEINNSFASATGITGNTEITDASIHNGDIDYFRFNAEGNANTTVNLYNIPTGCDYDLYIYDSNYNKIRSGTNNGNTPENLTLTLPQGTYYVKVLGYNNCSSDSYYKLQISSAYITPTAAPTSTPTPVSSPVPTPAPTSPPVPSPSGTISVPSAPYNLQAAAGCDRVRLTWEASLSSSPPVYTIKYATVPGGPYETLVSGWTGTSLNRNGGFTDNTTYYFIVTAENSSGTSSPSNEAAATPCFPTTIAPLNLRAAVGNGSVSLAWDPVSGASMYNVYKSLVPGGPYVKLSSVFGSNYTHTGAINGSTYYYVVVALDNNMNDKVSNEVQAVLTD